jgi:hypothetical protein
MRKTNKPAQWRCSDCGRRFGRTNQSHSCVPSMTVDDYFEKRDANDRRIYEAVARYVQTLGDVTIDVVSIGVLIKRARTFAELRPKRAGMALSFLLSRTVDDERISRVIKTSAHRTAHFVDLAGPRDVDRDVKGWLAEAFASSPV